MQRKQERQRVPSMLRWSAAMACTGHREAHRPQSVQASEVSGTKLECIVRCKLDSSAESGADVDAEGCTLSHSDVTMAFLGEYFKISLKDADGNRVKGLSWKSGNTGVCTVDADGVVTATGKGTTTVSTTYGGKSFECIIRCNLK